MDFTLQRFCFALGQSIGDAKAIAALLIAARLILKPEELAQFHEMTTALGFSEEG